jgi:hypothetical protein
MNERGEVTVALPQEGDRSWLALGPASRRLDCSVDTLRRRIKSGDLEARKVPSRHGPSWQVRLPPNPSADMHDAAAMVRLVADLHAQAMELAEQVGGYRRQMEQLQEDNERLRAELALRAAQAASAARRENER